MRKLSIVRLSEVERASLHTLIGQGVAPASKLAHARILLKANQGEAGPGWTDGAIVAALEVNPSTVARVRQEYVRAGWGPHWTVSLPRTGSTGTNWTASRKRI